MSRLPCQTCGQEGKQKCQCTRPPSVFCEACYQTHKHAKVGAQLQTAPMVVVQTDDTNWTYTVELLKWGLDEVLRARNTAESVYNSIIRTAHSHKLRLLSQLTSEITQLSLLIESYVAGSSPNLRVDQIRMSTSAGELPGRLQLISTSTSMEEAEAYLKCGFLYSVNKELFEPAAEELAWKDLELAYVPYFGNIMEHFVIDGGYRIDMPRNLYVVKDCSIWMPVSDTVVLLTGEKNSVRVYLCDVQNESFSLTQSTDFQHMHGGLGLYQDYAYLFGGKWKETSQRFCERFSLSTLSWSVLPCMQFPRSHFVPAREGRKFYLLGGQWTSTAEEFDCESLSFRTINLELNDSGRCFAGVYDGDLVVLLNGGKYVWEKRANSECLRSLGSWGEDTLMIHVPSVRNGDRMYIVGARDSNIALYCLDLSTKAITSQQPLRVSS